MILVVAITWLCIGCFVSVDIVKEGNMKRKLFATLMVFTLMLSMVYPIAQSGTPATAAVRFHIASRWGGDEMDDWPLSISCDPDYPIIGPEVGETREESITALQYEKGNRVKSMKIKNYSKDIVKIGKKKINTEYGAYFKVKGLKKGYAHIKVIVKIKYAQDGKTTYVWDIKKYPVGHNDD